MSLCQSKGWFGRVGVVMAEGGCGVGGWMIVADEGRDGG